MNNPKRFVFILFLLFSTHFYAQNREFAPIGAQWQYHFTSFGSHGTEIIKVEKDTFVDNEKVRKLRSTIYAINDFENSKKDTFSDYNLLKIRNDSVFRAMSAHDFQQYTWKYLYKAHPQLNDSIDWGSDSLLCFKKGKVDSLYVMRIQDSMHKVARYRVETKSLFLYPYEVDTFFYLNFVEGIGFIDDYIYMSGYCFESSDAGVSGDLCFQYGNTYYSHNNNSTCRLVASTIENAELKMSISPNPVRDILTIDFAENIVHETPFGQGGRVSVLNVMGQKVLEQNFIIGQNTQRVDMSDIANGIYFLTTTMGKKIDVHKVIVQH